MNTHKTFVWSYRLFDIDKGASYHEILLNINTAQKKNIYNKMLVYIIIALYKYFPYIFVYRFSYGAFVSFTTYKIVKPTVRRKTHNYTV